MTEPVDLQSDKAVKTFVVRLTPANDERLRNGFHLKGDISAQLAEILETVNLETVDLQHVIRGRAAHDVRDDQRARLATAVRLVRGLYKGVAETAAARGVSITTLINSAIAAHHGHL